jgi:allophanate hydrolase subunit 1
VIDTVPGVRSLLIVYDNLKLDLDQLLRILVAIEENINDGEVRTAKLPRYAQAGG